MSRFAVLSGDLRQYYINEYFKMLGLNSELKINMNFDGIDYIIASTPFSKDGQNINCDFYTSFPISSFTNLINENQIVFGGNMATMANICSKTNNAPKIIDILKDDFVVWNNAALTAEGLIGKIIYNTPFAINNTKICIMGFGKCGINIALKLKSLGANIFIYDHTPIHMYQAQSMGYDTLDYNDFCNKLNIFNIVINTVPSQILTLEHYQLLKKDCVLFEIASYPFGFDENHAKNNQLSLITCPALPGATAPKDAGELIAKSIISYLERNGINEL